MPRIAMDYSKVVIYHFICQDPTQLARYVGSTTNYIKRKAQHKVICHKADHKDYHKPLYQTIRDNGGWDKWEMKPLEEYPCENHVQQQIREQYWMDYYNPTLNPNRAHIADHVEARKEFNKKDYAKHRDERLDKQRTKRAEKTLSPDLPSVPS